MELYFVENLEAIPYLIISIDKYVCLELSNDNLIKRLTLNPRKIINCSILI